MSSNRPTKPVGRYWRGKAPSGPGASYDSDESDDEGLQIRREEEKKRVDGLVVVNEGQARKARTEIKRVPAVKKEDVVTKDAEEESEESSEEETSEEEKRPVYRPSGKLGQVPRKEVSSEYETDSGEEESEEEVSRAPMYKPIFVPKRQRLNVTQQEETAEEAETRRKSEIEERQEQSRKLVEDTLKRELAEKEAKVTIPDVDDTDGLDPEAEFEAWKLRELKRLERDQTARYAREQERMEIEERRAMPEELRLKEDLERAKASRENKSRGQQAFLQKYWHKGAFYSDQDVLKKHDFSAATESTVVSMETLPEIMQVRNFGKAHRTKYTHLAKEDTSKGSGGWGVGKRRPPGAGAGGGVGGSGDGCFVCGGPHMKKDCPNLNEAGGPSGANNVAARRDRGGDGYRDRDGFGGRGPREELDYDGVPRGPRDRGDRVDGGRRDDRGGRDRDRSRSRSPPRRRGSPGRRRSRSRDRDGYGGSSRGRDDRGSYRDRGSGDRGRDSCGDGGKSRKNRVRSRSRESDGREKRRRVD